MKIFKQHPLNFRAGAIYDPKIEARRMEIISRFMGCYGLPVLDVGEKNGFGAALASEAIGDGYPINTSGDLDAFWIPSAPKLRTYPTVWIFEVIEHLMNPLLFMLRLRNYCDNRTRIFITYPRHSVSLFWAPNHFHEMDKFRFRHLVESAGYEIVKHKKKILYRKWSSYFKGLRPLCRLFLFPNHHNYYELRMK